MPADVEHVLQLGVGGLNFRDQPAQIRQGELSDSLNWQLDQNGALVKRLGSVGWGDLLAANVLETHVYWPEGSNPVVLAHLDDGTVQASTDGSWTQIDTGLSTSIPIGFAQYLDKAYYSDGVNAMRQWDGLTLTLLPTVDANDVQTLTVTGGPGGGSLTVTLDGQTATIPYDATSGVAQPLLEALSNIGTGNVLVTGGPLPGTPLVITFRADMGFRPVDLMTTSGAGLTGGTTPASAITHTTPGAAAVPLGRLLTVWRNRLWVGFGREVWWSAAGDPTSYVTKTNFVSFPDDTNLTALVAMPNSSVGADGSDGVLVFSRRRMHRITDDSDNVVGVVTGGSSVLVDQGQGCLGQRSLAELRGRIYLAGRGGVYSTDGHAPLRLESSKIRPVFDQIGRSQELSVAACAWRGRYYLAYQPTGEIRNSRLLELCVDLPSDGEGEHPWMAHTVPAASFAVLLSTEAFLFADASEGDGGYVRQAFSGGTDITGDADTNAFQARCRSGALAFGIVGRKRVRRVQAFGAGTISCGISSDFSSDSGESGVLDASVSSEPLWDSVEWDEFVWGPVSDAASAIAYYTREGRFLTFELVESGATVRTGPSALGYPGPEIGGAALYAMDVRLIPLDP